MKRARKSSEKAGSDPKKFAKSVSAKTGDQDQKVVCYVDHLPDHLVVDIFKLLDTKTVAFLLPQVCKRWSRLASSEDLWKDACLYYSPYGGKSRSKLFYKCLKMAPCLKALTLEVDYKHGVEFALKFNVNSNSPREIKEVEFIYDNMPPEVMFTLLRKHKNHLEKLTINDTFTPYVESDVKRIWNDIQNLSKLKLLRIDGCALFYNKATFRKNSPCWKTLEILDVKDCSYEDMNTVQKLITVNPNWKQVYLSVTSEDIFRGEVKALAKCGILECVRVPFCKEIKLLEKCEKLMTLIIDCLGETANEVDNVLPIFAKSNVFQNLKTIKMENLKSGYMKLLLCLVKDRPAINVLSLAEPDISATELREILNFVPDLEHLYIHSVDSKTLVSILDDMADGFLPKLKEFDLSECYCNDDSNPKKCIKLHLTDLKRKRPDLKFDFEVQGCGCKSDESEGNNTSFQTDRKEEDTNGASGGEKDQLQGKETEDFKASPSQKTSRRDKK